MSRPPGPAAFDDPGFAARIRARDGEAIRAVVHAYLPHILRAARGAGLNRERAEDVAQETFKTFIESAGRFEGRSHVRTWVFGIFYRKVSEMRRAAQKEERGEDIDEVVESRFDTRGMWARPPLAADRDTYDSEISRYIEGCMEPLPENQRLAFVLKEVEGMNSEEICKTLDVTRTNLGVLLYRARNALRECLERLQPSW
ncbi:sigma-70 family RNA polymerase sigma factor [bacterium]|nr:sigma-70 family RNA polymerase sigma factor [bacterium]MBU1072877.1 sigma-70 family RNA polymerase sigma factor [bacterium]MBU1675243.1 sigma-70 family RNA polymerase sigma factor [bacterium]